MYFKYQQEKYDFIFPNKLFFEGSNINDENDIISCIE